MCKEIAYQWAENKLLKFKKLVFLLFLRDPTIKQIMSLETLIQYFFESTKIASGLSEYFFQTKGKGLVFIFDGYDEISEEDRNNSFLAKLINRNKLPECDLVITSRPSASLSLRDVADCRVEVLGFTEEDRLDYIQHALEGSNDKIKALQIYLQSNSTINALCYVPLNMTILLCLFEEIECSPHSTLDLDNKEDIGLPNTQTEMYEKFILMTITRFIKKSNNTFSGKCLTFSDLPEPYNEAFNELLHLAYNALTKDQIVFSLNDEVVQACPILKSGNCEGLGLLKVTEYVNNVLFHFLHFSIQESLAAYYIASQSSSFQVKLLRDTFWDIHYFNTWIMYVGMTGGKKEAWRHFVSGNRFMLFTKVFKSSKISKKYLNDKIKSLHLFQCFAEIGNKESVGKVFKDKTIDLSNQTLLPRDINTICFFLLRSVNKHWIKLDLSSCNIGDTGSEILCKTFLDKSRDIVSIDKVNLSHNQLQTHSLLGLLDVFKVWHASEVVIYESHQDNESGLFELCLNKLSLYDDESFSQIVLIGPFIFAHNVDIHNQIKKSANVTTGLYLNHCNYPSTNFTCEELSDKLNLSKLHIIGGNIHCHFIGALVQTLKEVDSVYIYDHSLSDEDVKHISSLVLSKINSSDLGVWVVIGRTKILGDIPDMFALNKLSPIEISNLTENIKGLCSSSSMSTTKFNKYFRFESKSVFENFFYMLHENVSKCEIDFCLSENNLLFTNGKKYSTISKVLSSNNSLTSIYITKCKLNATELTNIIGNQGSLEKLYIVHSSLDNHNFKFEILLNQSLRLKELFIHNTDSSCTLTFDLLEARKWYPNISVLLITNNTLIGHNPTCEQILLSLKLQTNLAVWRIYNFPTNVEFFQKIANTLSNVMELDITGYNLEEHEFQQYNNQSNDEQDRYHGISKQTIDDIGKVLSYFTKLKTLNLCHNNLQEAGVGKMFKYLSIPNLTKLNISHNETDEEAVDDIAKFLSQMFKLEELDLSYNNLQVTEVATLISEVQNTSSCTKLNVSHNNINDEAAHNIATFLSHNTQFRELDLSHCDLQTIDAITVCKGMISLIHLTKLNVSNNNISGEAAGDLAVVLSQNVLLEELDLSYNNLGAFGSLHIFRNMKKLSTLIKLNVCNIGLTEIAADDIVNVLNNNIKLQELDLSHNHIQATGATTIFKMASTANLHKFIIGHNNISDNVEFLESFLSRHTNLEELDFSHNNIQAVGAIKVCRANLSKLTKFNISHNGITIDAVVDIGILLSRNTKLQKFDLSGNDLKLGYIKSLQGISNLSCLQEFDLSHNNLSTSDIVKIFSGMKNISNLVTINTSHNVITDMAGYELAAVLSHNIKLQEINFSFNDLSTSATMSIFKGMKSISNLKKIDISHNMITDEASEIIATVLSCNKKLQSLDLSYNYFTSEGLVYIFEHLKSIVYLRKLNVSSNEITVKAAHSITTVLSLNSKLEELDLSRNNLLSAGAIKVCRTNLSKLTAFNISHNGITTKAAKDIATFLSRNKRLEQLDLSHNSLLSAGVTNICNTNLSYLTTLNISHNGIIVEAADDVSAFLSHNSKLQVLDLSCSDLQESGCMNVFKVLQNKSVLTSLKLSNCNVINEAADKLATVLLNNISLQELDLSYNNLSKSDSATILKGMKNISNLVTINIGHNMITNAAVDDLVCILFCNASLKEIDLCSNCISASSAIKIFKGMEKISNLETINISHNMITDEAAENIATFLSHNSKLQTLNMSFNYLGSKGCIKIFNGMKNLSNLNISHNNITAEATVSIAAVLSHNTKLKQLDISYNDLQTPGAIEIFQGIKHTSTLTKLNIAHNMITEEATEYVINILHNYTRLKELNLSDNSLLEKDVIMKIMLSSVHKFNNSVDQTANKLLKIITLQELDLSNISSLQTAGIIKVFKELIHNSAFTKVNISRHPICQSAAYNLANILSKNNDLQELVMSYNNLQAQSINTILGAVKSSNLTKLNISGNDANLITTANVLSQHTNLVELDLSYNKLNNAADVTWFITVSRKIFINLIKLNISGIFHEISNEAAADLAYIFSQNNMLNELDLSNNNLYPEVASIILNGLNASALIKFRISHNNISDRAASDIATFLCKCINLEELDLSYNSLQNTGATEICIANISSLTSFNISHNNITIKAADDVANFLSRNSLMQTFDLSNNGMLKVGVRNILKGMQVVQSIFNLPVLNIGNSSVVDETMSFNSLYVSDAVNILQGMKNVPNLVTINLSHTNITDEAADELATVLLHNTSLQNADLSYSNLSTSDAIKIFKGMKNISKLETVNISHNMITNEAADELATVLSHNNSIQIFDMSSNYFSSEGCIKIMNGMSNVLYLKKIDISCNKITYTAADSIATFLSHNSELDEFILSCNDFQKSYLFKKMESVKLTKLDVSFALPEVDDIATVLMHNIKLEDINLSNNELLSDDIIKVCLKMKNILNLKRFNISYNWITCEAADDIVNVLSHNTNLQELYLSNNYLQSDGIVTLFNRMSNISKLTHLDISSNKITDEAAGDITVFLLQNNNLKVLDLSNNLIQETGARTIFGKTNTNFGLKILNISGNALDDEAASIIATFLSQNRSLEEIDLSKNYLEAVGAMKIFKAIQNCPNILKVSMSNNRITDDAGVGIAVVLSTDIKLREVDLDCNLLSAEMSDYIKRAFIKLQYYEL